MRPHEGGAAGVYCQLVPGREGDSPSDRDTRVHPNRASRSFEAAEVGAW